MTTMAATANKWAQAIDTASTAGPAFCFNPDTGMRDAGRVLERDIVK
jgi:hypothetical protein